MVRHFPLILLSLVILLTYNLSSAEIHRAKNLKAKYYQHRFHDDVRNAEESIINIPDPENEDDGQPQEEEHLWFGYSRNTWLYSIISASLVGLSGIFPLLVIPLEAGKSITQGVGAARLQLLLSFAVGGLLGDVFLHLLPESWSHVNQGGDHDHKGHLYIGLWVLAGILCFLIIEKAFPDPKEEEEVAKPSENSSSHISHTITTPHGSKPMPAVVASHENAASAKKGKKKGARQRKKDEGKDADRSRPNGWAVSNGTSLSNGAVSNGVAHHALANGHAKTNGVHVRAETPPETRIKTIGWLNLLANVIDNFTHGLAVGGSYCISTKTGMLTTAAILLHEVPHEIGDFAILLRAGFNRWKAAQAQMLTATGGMVGALVALTAESAKEAGDRTAWVLPFTSGGFIYIALVTIVPDLLHESRPWESVKQVFLLCCGIGVMATVTLFFD